MFDNLINSAPVKVELSIANVVSWFIIIKTKLITTIINDITGSSPPIQLDSMPKYITYKI